VLSIQRSFRARSVRSGFVCLILLLAGCYCSLPVLAQGPAAPPAAPPATQPPVAGADASIPSPQLMSLNTFNTFDVSDVPPAPPPCPPATGSAAQPSNAMAPSFQGDLGTFASPNQVFNATPLLERTPLGRLHPLRSMSRPAPAGSVPSSSNVTIPFGFLFFPNQNAAPAPTAPAMQSAGAAPVGSQGRGGGPHNMMLAPGASSAPAAVPPGPGEPAIAPGTNTTEPSFLKINDFSLGGRAASFTDTTRVDPAAQSLFLPSAIPVRGESNFGLGEQTQFNGTGSSIGLGWVAPNVPLVGDLQGAGKVEMVDLTSGNVTASVTQAWLNWQNLTFGLTDTTFNDVLAVPETLDLGGPISHPSFYGKNPAVIRYLVWQPVNQKTDPTGFYVNVAAEQPNQDIFVPAGFQTFSRYPDFIATLKYENGVWGKDNCTGTPFFDGWHAQFGALVRDLGVEDSNKQKDVLREETTGWGLQLSGAFTIPRECNLFDFFYWNVVGGEGLARYFNDFNLVTPVDDASFNSITRALTPLPVFGYFAAYQHDWNPYFRSTAVYSHLDLDSNPAVGAPGTSPYRHGDYVSANLIFHYNACDPPPDGSPPKTPNTEHTLIAGIEYLYGHREDLNGNRGQDQRIMFVVTATK
jgi:hypothetical protein